MRGFQDVQATAAEFIPLPTIEIRLAAKTKRSGRWLKLSRIPLLYLSGFPPSRHKETEKKRINTLVDSRRFRGGCG